MKSRDSAAKLKRFEANEKARKVADLEHMIREFEGMVTDLDRQIQAEEDRTGVRDRAHFAYSMFAKSAATRRDNLKMSIENLRLKHDAALRDRDEALADVSRVDQPAPREALSSRRRTERETKASVV